MSNIDQVKLKAMAAELAKDIKTQADLANLSSMLLKMTVEAALGAEMEHHLGYSKHDTDNNQTTNAHNGYSSKPVKGDHGEVEIEVPRDRDSSFEPIILPKRQTRLTDFDDQILALYARGMTTRDIVATFKEMYGADVSATLVSNVTESVLAKVTEWRTRLLDECYPIVYLDGISIKVRQANNKQVVRKTMYVMV
jgi:transposase-like protein